MEKSAEDSALEAECDALLGAVDLFRRFVPSDVHAGSGHAGEEGRFTESLVAQFLKRSLPTRLSVGTGFVLDPANGRRSYQVDILVYDNSAYPHYLQYGDAVVIPWQAVVGAVSVKKNLRKADISKEVSNLSYIGEMCGGSGRAAPYLGLLAFEATVAVQTKEAVKQTFAEVAAAYPNRGKNYSTNELIDTVVVLNDFVLIKKRWKSLNPTQKRNAVAYMWTAGHERRSLRLMHVLHGIEAVFYEGLQAGGERPFRRSFPSGVFMKQLGTLPVVCEDRPG